MPAIKVQSSDAIILGVMIDDSGSIRFEGNSQNVCDGHNLLIDAMNGSKQGDSILMHTRYLNGKILFPYCLLADA